MVTRITLLLLVLSLLLLTGGQDSGASSPGTGCATAGAPEVWATGNTRKVLPEDAAERSNFVWNGEHPAVFTLDKGPGQCRWSQYRSEIAFSRRVEKDSLLGCFQATGVQIRKTRARNWDFFWILKVRIIIRTVGEIMTVTGLTGITALVLIKKVMWKKRKCLREEFRISLVC